MTLDEAIRHCLNVSKQCDNIDCALDHKQLADWLIDLKNLTKNGYSHFCKELDKNIHDFTVAAIVGRLSSNPTISSEEMAALVNEDVKAIINTLKLKCYEYK